MKEDNEIENEFSIEKKFIITVRFDKKKDGVPYKWEDLEKYANNFPERLVGFKRNKNETLFATIKKCKRAD